MPADSVILVCHGCRQQLRVPVDRLGDTGKCPRCGSRFAPIVPARSRRWVGRLITAYAVLIAALLVLLWQVGEGWWAGTLLLYSPRWPFLLPVPVLGLLALRRPRLLAGLGLVTAAWVWLGMGFEVRGLRAERTWDPGGMVVLTWNAGGTVRQPEVFRTYLAVEAPDVVLLQEAGGTDQAQILPAGWQAVRSEGGLIAASPHPVRLVSEKPPHAFRRPGTWAAFEVDVGRGPVRVVSVHLPTPRPGLEGILGRDPEGKQELESVADDQDHASELARLLGLEGPLPLVVAGDFNLTPESQIFRRHWGDLADAFDRAGFGFGYTKRTRWHGARIDHILYDDAWACDWCGVGPAMGSDHRPVIAHLRPAGR